MGSDLVWLKDRSRHVEAGICRVLRLARWESHCTARASGAVGSVVRARIVPREAYEERTALTLADEAHQVCAERRPVDGANVARARPCFWQRTEADGAWSTAATQGGGREECGTDEADGDEPERGALPPALLRARCREGHVICHRNRRRRDERLSRERSVA